MSLSIDKDKVKEAVTGILSARAVSVEKLTSVDNVVGSDADRVRRFKSLLLGLKASIADSTGTDPIIRAAHDTCSEYIEQANEIISESEECCAVISRVKEHFLRDEFCVASAGGSQAGKSTTLQKIVGMDETADKFCPIVGGGNGNSTTATRCQIVNIGTNEHNHARIEFYTQEDFFIRVVKPYCRELQQVIPLPSMESYDDFIAFDATSFEQNNESVLLDLENGNNDRAKKYWNRFLRLRNKVNEYGPLLNTAPQEVALEEAYKYLVYPSAKPEFNLQSWCYAVREATIYCKYPNPVVEKIKFFDLPGAGEVAPDVEKRYAEGFNLKTDTVVYVGRYDGTPYGNAAVDMVDILGRVVPSGQLDNYVLHFQNDFGIVPGDNNKLARVMEINKGTKRDAYAIIGREPDIKIYRVPAQTEHIDSNISRYEVNAIGTEGLVVVFGEGNDAEYVTGTLLPVICTFASVRLPFLDQSLIGRAQTSSEQVAGKVVNLFTSAIKAFQILEKKIPSPRGTFPNWVDKRVEELRNALQCIRMEIDEKYDQGSLFSGIIDEANTPQGIRDRLVSIIEDKDSGLFIEKDKDSLMSSLKMAEARVGGLSGLLIQYLRALRVTITDQFSHLEDTYAKSISLILTDLFSRLRDFKTKDGAGVPFLAANEGESLLDAWIKVLDAAGCEKLSAFARDMRATEVKFFLTVYPDIRRKVFSERIDDVYKRWLVDCGGKDQHYATLKDLATNWTEDTCTCVVGKNAAREIIYSAIDRFFERTLNAAGANDELKQFVAMYCDILSADRISPVNVCKTKLQTLVKDIEIKCVGGEK